jgi:transposase
VTATAPRPLADLEQDALARVEAEFARRARGARPWTTTEYVDRIEQVHIRYNHRRHWLRTHEQETAI